jgi:hypothetical protein
MEVEGANGMSKGADVDDVANADFAHLASADEGNTQKVSLASRLWCI